MQIRQQSYTMRLANSIPMQPGLWRRKPRNSKRDHQGMHMTLLKLLEQKLLHEWYGLIDSDAKFPEIVLSRSLWTMPEGAILIIECRVSECVSVSGCDAVWAVNKKAVGWQIRRSQALVLSALCEWSIWFLHGIICVSCYWLLSLGVTVCLNASTTTQCCTDCLVTSFDWSILHATVERETTILLPTLRVKLPYTVSIYMLSVQVGLLRIHIVDRMQSM